MTEGPGVLLASIDPRGWLLAVPRNCHVSSPCGPLQHGYQLHQVCEDSLSSQECPSLFFKGFHLIKSSPSRMGDLFWFTLNELTWDFNYICREFLHLCHILLARRKSLDPAHPPGERIMEGMDNTGWGLGGPSQNSVYHIYVPQFSMARIETALMFREYLHKN